MNDIAGPRIVVQLDVKLHHYEIEQHVAASPHVIGIELAEQIDEYVRANQLGYYPALDYFRGQDYLDSDLIGTAESIAWLIENLTLEYLKICLRPLLTDIKFELMKAQLFLLPNVRPSNNNAMHTLTNHFTPDHIKVTLNGILRLNTKESETELVKQCRTAIKNILSGKFSCLDITGIHLLPEHSQY